MDRKGPIVSHPDSAHLRVAHVHKTDCLPALPQAPERPLQAGTAMQGLQLQRAQEVYRQDTQGLHRRDAPRWKR